jgi:hypothetical protein
MRQVLVSLYCLAISVFFVQGGDVSAAAPPELDAVLHAKVDAAYKIQCQFQLPGKADQSFQSNEYRCYVLNDKGILVGNAIRYYYKTPHTVDLPKHQRSVSDDPDAGIDTGKLTPGDYMLVVIVRQLIGAAKFKIP